MAKAQDDLAARIVRLGEGETLTVFGRCSEKGCRHRVRLDVPRVMEVAAAYGNAPQPDRFPETASMTAWIGTAAWLHSDGADLHACPTHGYRPEWKGLKATRVASIVCSNECRTAVSEVCRCSCGGADHGII